MARPLPPGDEPGDFSFLNTNLNADSSSSPGFDFAEQADDLAAFDASGFPGFPSEESAVGGLGANEIAFSDLQFSHPESSENALAETAGEEQPPQEPESEDAPADEFESVAEQEEPFIDHDTAVDAVSAEAPESLAADSQFADSQFADSDAGYVETLNFEKEDLEAGGFVSDSAEEIRDNEGATNREWSSEGWGPSNESDAGYGSDAGYDPAPDAQTEVPASGLPEIARIEGSDKIQHSTSSPLTIDDKADDAADPAAVFAAMALHAAAADAVAGLMPKIEPTPLVNPAVNPVRAASRSGRDEKSVTSQKTASPSTKPTERDAAKVSATKSSSTGDSVAVPGNASAARSQPSGNTPQSSTGKDTSGKDSSSKAVAGKASAGKSSPALMGYAIALTLLFILLVVTGRVSLFGHHALESLPDLRPLAPNEFRRVPDGTPVPENHVLKLGESRRFGDVVLTPLRVTREPLKFQGFLTGEPEETLTTTPVLKLWMKFENQSDSYGFPPWDAGLMSNRTPPISSDESTLANSFLTVIAKPNAAPVRVLNYLQTMDSNFVITGQQSAKVIMPEESLETFIASSEDISVSGINAESECTWRIQFRKGVNESSGNGVTTLIEVRFSGSDIVM